MASFNVLGINDGHNAGAALLCDGRIVAAVSEERFVRRKNACGYPQHAVEYCLGAAQLEPGDVTLAVYSGRAVHPLWAALRREEMFDTDHYLSEQEYYWKWLPVGGPAELQTLLEDYARVVARRDDRFDVFSALERWGGHSFKECLAGHSEARRIIAANCSGINPERVVFADHHRCHSAYAFFSAPHYNSEVLILTMDASGDGINATISIGGFHGLCEIFRTDKCDLARLYRAITLCLGFKPNEHEYKVMGLAPYAPQKERERAVSRLLTLFQDIDDFDFIYPSGGLSFEHLFSKVRELIPGLRFDGIAAAVQTYVEDLVTRWIAKSMKAHSLYRVVFAGGMAMNVKVNASVLRIPGLLSFVPPGPGDESLPIGAAYLGFDQIRVALGLPVAIVAPLDDAYLGPGLDCTEIEEALRRLTEAGFIVTEVGPTRIAAELAGGRILGRFAGRMEFGPRALGNRSILADPVSAEMAQRINRCVKRRDFWMPFSPLALERDGADLFEMPILADARFMTLAMPVTETCARVATAAIHASDGSARPQLLPSNINPELEAILDAFRECTGRPVLLNTSLNVHGTPIVNSPLEAAEMLLNHQLDGLILGNHFVTPMLSAFPV